MSLITQFSGGLGSRWLPGVYETLTLLAHTGRKRVPVCHAPRTLGVPRPLGCSLGNDNAPGRNVACQVVCDLGY